PHDRRGEGGDGGGRPAGSVRARGRPVSRREAPAPALGAVRYGPDGLVPAVVQDEADGRLWRKGETSGNVLRLRGLALDCDGDALLVTVRPAGPTCHRGTRSCFDDD